MLIASYCGKTYTQRHDKRHRHRTGGHPAGIKRNCKEIIWHEEGQEKNKQIEQDQ